MMFTQSKSISQKRTNIFNARTLAMTAMLSAVSFVLAFIECPVPLSPSFAKMDLSDFPALIGAFAFGPTIGVIGDYVCYNELLCSFIDV
ncbi:MAG: ECF transporter S component [Peptococcaceae bacterium]|nr:ECF transporter S component [Peptococcaceae bacterium]